MPRVFSETQQARGGGGTRVGELFAIGRQWNGCQPDDQCRQVPHLREGRPERGIGGQPGHRRHLAPGSPRPLNVSRQRACRSEKEVTDPDVAGIDEAPRCSTRPYRLPQITLARISRNHMRQRYRREANATNATAVQPAQPLRRTPGRTATTCGRRARTGSSSGPATARCADGADWWSGCAGSAATLVVQPTAESEW